MHVANYVALEGDSSNESQPRELQYYDDEALSQNVVRLLLPLEQRVSGVCSGI